MHCLLSGLYLYQQWFLFRSAVSCNGGRGFWTKYGEAESLWMGLCISYQPIWVQIGFEVLPTSTMDLFSQHIKASSASVITFRRQGRQPVVSDRKQSPPPQIRTSFPSNQFNLTLVNLQMCSVREVVDITAYQSKCDLLFYIVVNL